LQLALHVARTRYYIASCSSASRYSKLSSLRLHTPTVGSSLHQQRRLYIRRSVLSYTKTSFVSVERLLRKPQRVWN
jgi:hypothetical protein